MDYSGIYCIVTMDGSPMTAALQAKDDYGLGGKASRQQDLDGGWRMADGSPWSAISIRLLRQA